MLDRSRDQRASTKKGNYQFHIQCGTSNERKEEAELLVFDGGHEYQQCLQLGLSFGAMEASGEKAQHMNYWRKQGRILTGFSLAPISRLAAMENWFGPWLKLLLIIQVNTDVIVCSIREMSHY